MTYRPAVFALPARRHVEPDGRTDGRTGRREGLGPAAAWGGGPAAPSRCLRKRRRPGRSLATALRPYRTRVRQRECNSASRLTRVATRGSAPRTRCGGQDHGGNERRRDLLCEQGPIQGRTSLQSEATRPRRSCLTRFGRDGRRLMRIADHRTQPAGRKVWLNQAICAQASPGHHRSLHRSLPRALLRPDHPVQPPVCGLTLFWKQTLKTTTRRWSSDASG
jgi:hypothetical protein